MIKFGKEKVLLLQKLVIESSGGTAGLRDVNLLDSALESAFQTFDGKELYPSKEQKAARLGVGLVSNHAFLDGNKRAGLLVMISFLAINGIKLEFKDEELVELGLSLAEGKTDYEKLLAWINSHKSEN